MEALVGTTIERPLRSGGPFDSVVNAYRMPIPNRMAAQADDEPERYLWVYPIHAGSAYRPPRSSPLDCEVRRVGEFEPTVRLRCSAEERDERGAWAYVLEFYPEYESGSLSATLTPE